MKRIAVLGVLLLFFTGSALAAAPGLSPELIEALKAVEANKASPRQQALLFANNDVINKARLRDWLSDKQYQAAQKDFSKLNEGFAADAAQKAGAKLEKQVSKSDSFSPGTDSDYIAQVESPEQVRQMQKNYNDNINKFLGDNEVFQDPDAKWHETLDTDFMADPRHVTQAQFEEIAKMNNAAYTRREAAEYERISRAQDGSTVKPEHINAYADEMQDLIVKKQKALAKMRETGLSKADRADIALTMGQEQKYIERIEAATDHLRRQNNLKPIDRNVMGAGYSVVKNEQGNVVLRHKNFQNQNGNIHFRDRALGSIARRGANRAPENFFQTASANAVSQNSLNRSLSQLAETQAQVAAVNSDFSATATKDIAQLTKNLPASDKGFLLDKIKKARGGDFAAEVAREMRNVSPPKPNNPAFDQEIVAAVDKGKIQPEVDPTPSLTNARRWDKEIAVSLGLKPGQVPTKKQMKELAQRALPKLNGMMDILDLAVEAADAGSMMGEYAYHINAAMGKDVPDEVAQQHFEAAREVAYGMVEKGTVGTAMAVTMQAFPTVGAVIGTYTASYSGTRFVLENTRTGQYIDKLAGGAFDIGFRGADKLTNVGASDREESEGARLWESYERALQEGRIKLRKGATAEELRNAALRGDIATIKDDIVEGRAVAEPEKETKPATPQAGPNHYSVGIFEVKTGTNIKGGRVIGVVLPPEEYAPFRPHDKREEHYGDLKVLKENLSMDEARQFIFVALYLPEAPVAKGKWRAGAWVRHASEIVEYENKTAKHVNYDDPRLDIIAPFVSAAQIKARYHDLRMLREGLTESEATDWICLQTKPHQALSFTKTRQEKRHIFQGKSYDSSACISFDASGRLLWGIHISKEREQWILDHLTTLKASPLIVPSLNPDKVGGWGRVAQQMQDKNSAAATGTKSGKGHKSWGDVAESMNKPVGEAPLDLGYILKNRSNPALVSKEQLMDAMRHPLLWQQPEVQRMIGDWISKAKPELALKDPTAHYEEWGRVVGRGIRVTGKPDIDEPLHQYLWRNADKFPSLNLCSMKDYVTRRMVDQSLEDCPRPEYSTAAAQGNNAAPREQGAHGSWKKPKDASASSSSRSSGGCTVVAGAPLLKLADVPYWTQDKPDLVGKPVVAVFLTYWDKETFDLSALEQQWAPYLGKVEVIVLSANPPAHESGRYRSVQDMAGVTNIPFGEDPESRVHFSLSGKRVANRLIYPHVLVFDASGNMVEDIEAYNPSQHDRKLQRALDNSLSQGCARPAYTHDKGIADGKR